VASFNPFPLPQPVYHLPRCCGFVLQGTTASCCFWGKCAWILGLCRLTLSVSVYRRYTALSAVSLPGNLEWTFLKSDAGLITCKLCVPVLRKHEQRSAMNARSDVLCR
jgi:hypothetical protein